MKFPRRQRIWFRELIDVFGFGIGPVAFPAQIKMQCRLCEPTVGAQRQRYIKSVAQFQFLRNRLITAHIRVVQIIQQTSALADHHQQPAARAVVFLVGLQMFGQMIDALGQQRDLHVRRTLCPWRADLNCSIVFVFASICNRVVNCSCSPGSVKDFPKPFETPGSHKRAGCTQTVHTIALEPAKTLTHTPASRSLHDTFL